MMAARLSVRVAINVAEASPLGHALTDRFRGIVIRQTFARTSSTLTPTSSMRASGPRRWGRTGLDDRRPTVAEQVGIIWWNGLTERARADWLRRAGSTVPADAWRAFKAESVRL